MSHREEPGLASSLREGSSAPFPPEQYLGPSVLCGTQMSSFVENHLAPQEPGRFQSECDDGHQPRCLWCWNRVTWVLAPPCGCPLTSNRNAQNKQRKHVRLEIETSRTKWKPTTKPSSDRDPAHSGAEGPLRAGHGTVSREYHESPETSRALGAPASCPWGSRGRTKVLGWRRKNG